MSTPTADDVPRKKRRRRSARLLLTTRARLEAPLELFARIAQPFAVLLLVFLGGSVGFFLLGIFYEENWSVLDSAFMTIITITTVGYGDMLGVQSYAGGKLYTMVLLLVGMGATLYSLSSLTAFFVEGDLARVFREVRMRKIIGQMKGHAIICGAGTTGTHVISEYAGSGNDFVVVDRSLENIQHAIDAHGHFPYVEGDSTDEDVLRKAGIDAAAELVAVLGEDKDNLFLVVTARYLAPQLVIIAKSIEHASVGKFSAAGASHVVSPTYIGGMRIASQALRPHVVDFLDAMLHTTAGARVAEQVIESGSELAGKAIAESRIGERVGLLVVAMKHPGESSFVYSPPSDTVLNAGSVIVVIGPVDKVTILERMAQA